MPTVTILSSSSDATQAYATYRVLTDEVDPFGGPVYREETVAVPVAGRPEQEVVADLIAAVKSAANPAPPARPRPVQGLPGEIEL